MSELIVIAVLVYLGTLLVGLLLFTREDWRALFATRSSSIPPADECAGGEMDRRSAALRRREGAIAVEGTPAGLSSVALPQSLRSRETASDRQRSPEGVS